MKLTEDNLKTALLKVLADSSTGKRYGLPEVSVDGVSCAVDTLNAVVRSGKGTDQVWWELLLRDVTPRRFLTPQQQADRDAEIEDWWMVTSTTRTAFVKSVSRSSAIEKFIMKFPEENNPDAELARGFDFVDDSTEMLEEFAKDVQES